MRGTTEGINLVASSWGRKNVKAGDEIVISAMEHHSNIVPWQMLCEEKGAKLRVIPINDRGELILEEYEKLLNPRTRMVAVGARLERAGHHQPGAARSSRWRTSAGALALIDGAQAAPHMKVDVQALDADFYAFSGHKVFGPTGIGILYGKAKLLNAMPPYQGGGDMIRTVTFEKTTYNDLPYKFEAGTPNIAGGIGLGAAIDYVNQHRARQDRRLRARTAGLRHAKRSRRFPGCASSARRAKRPRCFRSSWKAFTRTISARCSTGRESPCAPATIARSR